LNYLSCSIIFKKGKKQKSKLVGPFKPTLISVERGYKFKGKTLFLRKLLEEAISGLLGTQK
jgi:hypothetical protein